ncbi:hypothetical protein SAY86_030750 [Trapa natans]|uniref:Uncharacterized protein n=1 Tax=Trapa natans TaxID=22666 RepID=A0AAN7RAW9_TRANT|nr:hypothetical protein SAY86_030750 [Trapa natans]
MFAGSSQSASLLPSKLKVILPSFLQFTDKVPGLELLFMIIWDELNAVGPNQVLPLICMQAIKTSEASVYFHGRGNRQVVTCGVGALCNRILLTSKLPCVEPDYRGRDERFSFHNNKKKRK